MSLPDPQAVGPGSSRDGKGGGRLPARSPGRRTSALPERGGHNPFDRFCVRGDAAAYYGSEVCPQIGMEIDFEAVASGPRVVDSA
jgi:hypothetical protein